MPIALIAPDPTYRVSLLEAWDEFDAAEGEGGDWTGSFGFDRGTCATPEGFEDMCAHRVQEETIASPGFVTATMRWAVEDDQWLGRVSVRHDLNDHLLNEGGHIGYGVRPSARRRGIATQLMRAGLDVLRDRGVAQALVTCDDGNLGSATIIERAGGVLEDVRDGTRRYWVPTA